MNPKKEQYYQFDELSEASQSAALQKYRGINLPEDWYESVITTFVQVCTCVGVTVDPKTVHFDNVGYREQVCDYIGQIDITAMVAAFKDNALAASGFEGVLSVTAPEISPRIIRLIEAGYIWVTAWCGPQSRFKDKALRFRYSYTFNNCPHYSNIEAHMEKLECFADEVCLDLSNYLLNALEKEYEFQTSDEQVAETIRASGILFWSGEYEAEEMEQE